MIESLNQALLELSLKPGERRVVEVDGQHFEIRRIDGLLVDEGPMMYIPFDPPKSRNARTIIAKLGPRQLPDPIEINENDLAPG